MRKGPKSHASWAQTVIFGRARGQNYACRGANRARNGDFRARNHQIEPQMLKSRSQPENRERNTEIVRARMRNVRPKRRASFEVPTAVLTWRPTARAKRFTAPYFYIIRKRDVASETSRYLYV
mgnify:CR=1 FL=1